MTTIICEAGINHNGNMDNAFLLADMAERSGADLVKFQTWAPGRFPKLEQYEFTPKQWIRLFAHCDFLGIKWMSTPFDHESIHFLDDLGMKVWKVPSGLITNLPYLSGLAWHLPGPAHDRRLFMSTGMADLDEVKMARHQLTNMEVTLLHCHTAYPTRMDDVNLRVMRNLEEVFGQPVGLSDHTLGIEIPIAAVAMGATVIEKHMTLDRTQQGPDHRASLEPDEFKNMVTAIRNVEKAMGSGEKKPTEAEMRVRDRIREGMK